MPEVARLEHPGRFARRNDPPVSTSALELTLLGEFKLAADGAPQPVPEIASRIVALLAIHNQTMGRRAIASILWPDAPAANALASLRSVLFRLEPVVREQLGVTLNDLTLADGVEVDLERAQLLAHRLLAPNLTVDDADLGPPATVLLSSDLLPEWYDDWLTADARQWHELRVGALDALSNRLRSRGEFAAAIEAALAAIAGEPLRERGYDTLIRVHLARGDRPAALKVFANYRASIEHELHIPPSDALERLVMGAPATSTRSGDEASARRSPQTVVAGEDPHTFTVVAAGISMEPTIRHGDTLFVSEDVELAAGRIVVAMHGDVLIVKRLVRGGETLVLRSDNAHEEVQLDDVEVQGVVVQLLRST